MTRTLSVASQLESVESSPDGVRLVLKPRTAVVNVEAGNAALTFTDDCLVTIMGDPRVLIAKVEAHILATNA